MMKKLLLLSVLIGAFTMLSTNVNAQTAISTQDLTMGIDEVLLINAVNASGVTGAVALELTATVAGNAITGGSGTSYAQVSSIVASGQTRSITAAVTGIPAGTALSVTTAVPTSANDAGTVGTGTTDVALVNSAAAANIVTGIGSCYTGTVALDGYVLDWTWDAGASGDYGSIVSTVGATATVTLTITAGI